MYSKVVELVSDDQEHTDSPLRDGFRYSLRSLLSRGGALLSFSSGISPYLRIFRDSLSASWPSTILATQSLTTPPKRYAGCLFKPTFCRSLTLSHRRQGSFNLPSSKYLGTTVPPCSLVSSSQTPLSSFNWKTWTSIWAAQLQRRYFILLSAPGLTLKNALGQIRTADQDTIQTFNLPFRFATFLHWNIKGQISLLYQTELRVPAVKEQKYTTNCVWYNHTISEWGMSRVILRLRYDKVWQLSELIY